MQIESTTKEMQKNKRSTSTPGETQPNANQQNPVNIEHHIQSEKHIIITEENKDKVNAAILIGISDYGSQSTNLPQCENDISLAKEIITRVKNPRYMLHISGNCSGQEATDKIIEFFRDINDKEEKVDELFFYFTGHGIAHEKNNGEIESRLVFSDYAPGRVNQTTIPSEFIDTQARALAPNAYVKIIDSCYSGSKLIKGSIEQREKFLNELSKDEKHYTQVGFNSVYVMASSRSDQVSFANSKFSDFSESLFISLSELPGDVKYRHVVNRLADDFTSKEQRPVFVTQGSLDEGFGVISRDLKDYIYRMLTTEDTPEIPSNKGHNNNEEILLRDLAEKIKSKTSTRLFKKEDFHDFVKLINEKTLATLEALSPFYTVKIDASEKRVVPNEKFIGDWLKNSTHSYFARVRYQKPEVTTSSNVTASILNSAIGNLEHTRVASKNKALENQPIVGFTPVGMLDDANEENSRVREIRLTPNEDMRILDSILIYIVIINSQERIAVFTSIEACPLVDWDKYSIPKCPVWKTHEIKSANKKNETSSELDAIFNSMKSIAISLINAKSIDQEKTTSDA